MVLIDALDEAIERVSQEIAHRLDPPPDPTKAEAGLQNETNQKTETAAPETSAEMLGSLQEEQPLSWKEAVVLLESISGINQRAAEGILAEIGIEVARFPTAGHLASWSRASKPGELHSDGDPIRQILEKKTEETSHKKQVDERTLHLPTEIARRASASC